MEIILEFFCEIILSGVIEGSIDATADKKVSIPVRVIAALILILIYGSIFALLYYTAYKVFLEHKISGIVIFVLFTGIVALIVWGMIKKCKEIKGKKKC